MCDEDMFNHARHISMANNDSAIDFVFNHILNLHNPIIYTTSKYINTSFFVS